MAPTINPDSTILTPFAAAALLTSAQKAHLHAVASCLHTIYDTLVKMRFVDEDALIVGPHTPSPSLLQKYHELKLDPAIIYLYSIMPYVDSDLTSARDFFQGGELFNPLNESDVVLGRDPRYVDPDEGFSKENGEYMYPWYTPLSGCGNHASCIVYDAREERIWVVDQIEGCTTDPFFAKDWYGDIEEDKEESNWGESGDGGWSAEGEGAKTEEDSDDEENDEESEGGSEFWSDDEGLTKDEVERMLIDQEEDVDMEEEIEDEEEEEEEEEESEDDDEGDEVDNYNSLAMLQERSALGVLRDINRWYIELKELPGQGEHNGWLNPKLLRPLYRKHGWPNIFDSRAFDIGMLSIRCDESARYDAEEPLRKVNCYESWLDHSERDIRRYTQEIADADNTDAEWEARMKLWQAEESQQRNKKDLENAREKAARLCPGGKSQRDEDLPLWRLEKLRVKTKELQRTVRRNSKMPAKFIGLTEKILAWERKCRKDQEALELHETAYEMAKVDAERLCPYQTFQSATGIEDLSHKDTRSRIETRKSMIVDLQKHIKEAQEFGEKVPEEASKTRKAIKHLIEGHEQAIERIRDDQARVEKWLEEHGNETDV